MPRLARSLLAVGVALSTVTAWGVVQAAPASAASCSGSLTDSETISATTGGVIGELDIWYSSSSGGTNTACFRHRGAAYGVAATTSVRISAARSAPAPARGYACTVTARSSTDSGRYSYYAGPRSVTGTARYCVAAVGTMTWKGNHYSIDSGTQGC